jgi:hypothetical protein
MEIVVVLTALLIVSADVSTVQEPPAAASQQAGAPAKLVSAKSATLTDWQYRATHMTLLA